MERGWQEMEAMADFIFLGSKTLAPWKESYVKPRQHFKKQRHHLAYKGPSSQSYGLSSNHVWMWELDHKEGWVPKNWCFRTVVLEKTLESPLNCNPKGNQPWIGRTDAEAETPVLWPPYVKRRVTGKDPDDEKDWRQEEGAIEDEMVGWHQGIFSRVTTPRLRIQLRHIPLKFWASTAWCYDVYIKSKLCFCSQGV